MTGKHTDPSENTPLTPPTPPVPGPEPSIETQRAELADTVAALAAKADVPTRVQNSAHAQIEKAKTLAHDNAQIQKATTLTRENPRIVAASAGSVIGALLVVILLRRRRSRHRISR